VWLISRATDDEEGGARMGAHSEPPAKEEIKQGGVGPLPAGDALEGDTLDGGYLTPRSAESLGSIGKTFGRRAAARAGAFVAVWSPE